MHLSIHQRAAVIWLLASPIVFAPTLQIAKRPDAGLFLAQGIALVTIMIAVVPMLLKWPRFLWDANKVSCRNKVSSRAIGFWPCPPLEPPMIAACKAAIREEISKVTIEINDLRFQVRMTLYSHGSGVFRPFEGRCEALG